MGKDLTYENTMQMLLPLEESLQWTINPTIYDRKDFAARLKDSNSFVSRVMERPKIFLKGSEDDIKEFR